MSAASRNTRNPLRRKTVAMRPWDWSFPSAPVSHREVISAQPAEPSVNTTPSASKRSMSSFGVMSP